MNHSVSPMKTFLIALLSILGPLNILGGAPAAPGPSPTSSPDAALRAFVDSGRVPGVVALATTRDRVLHQAAIGQADTETEQPVRLDTIFAIASMTKPVTSVAVMQLVEQGRIDLGASVATYLPELAHPRVLEGFD